MLTTTPHAGSKHLTSARLPPNRRPPHYKSSPCASLIASDIKLGVIPRYKGYGWHMCGGWPEMQQNIKSPRLPLWNHITTSQCPHTLWEASCANSFLWGFGVFGCASCALQWLRLQQKWGRFGGLFKLGGHVIKRLQLQWDGWPVLLTGDSH